MSDTSTAVPDSLLERVSRALSVAEGRSRLIEELWARTPVYVREHISSASATDLVVPPQTSQLELIESVVVSVPSTATLYLAEMAWFFPSAGFYNCGTVAVILSGSDRRELIAQSAGAMAVTLMGHMLPQWGTVR